MTAPVAPVAANVSEYAVATFPNGSVNGVVIEIGVTLRVNCRDALFDAFDASAALAMNMNIDLAKHVLLCQAWKNWGTAKMVKHGTVILHSRADDVIPFADSEELARNSGATLIEVGNDHRLADVEPLEAMLNACE